MHIIDIKKISEDSGINIKTLATELFPNVKYPRLAINRIIAKEAVLDANQISKLSEITGIGIGDLYSENGWVRGITKGNLMKFTNGGYTAVLDTNTLSTKIFDPESVVHETVLNVKSITVSEYLEELNKTIIKIKTNEKHDEN